MSDQLYIGIDPGTSGGLAYLSRHFTEVVKMPKDLQGLWQILAGEDDAIAVIEKVHSSPQMGVKSAFTFGTGVGAIHMACIAAGIRMELVTPQKWQKEFGLIQRGRKIGEGDTDKKNRNKAKASELFPELVMTHWKADALLLAEYGRRNLVKGE